MYINQASMYIMIQIPEMRLHQLGTFAGIGGYSFEAQGSIIPVPTSHAFFEITYMRFVSQPGTKLLASANRLNRPPHAITSAGHSEETGMPRCSLSSVLANRQWACSSAGITTTLERDPSDEGWDDSRINGRLLAVAAVFLLRRLMGENLRRAVRPQ